jgi:hypothetical protein
MDDLRALAETYVVLTGQIEEVRRAMLACLSNGAAPNPIRPARVSSGSQAVHALATKEAESEIVALLRSQPKLTTSAITKATKSKQSTVSERLRRLRERGEISGGGADGWVAVSL